MISEAFFGDFFELERDSVNVDLDANYIQIGIKSFGRGVFHRAACKGSELGKLKYYHVYPGRLIFSNIMAWEGAIASSTWSERGTIGSQRFLSYRPKTSAIDIDFANYFFQSGAGAGLVRDGSTGSVKRNQTLAPKAIENFRIPVPALDDQRRIVDTLDKALSGLPKALESSCQVEADLVKSLLNFLFEREKKVTSAEFLELGLRPRRVAEGIRFHLAGVYSFGRGVFRRGLIDSSETKYLTLFEVRQGDLILSRLKAFEGAIAVVDEGADGCLVSQEFPTFRVDSSVCDHRYLSYLCRWPGWWSRLAGASKGVGSRRERVSAQKLLATELPLPSLARQEQIILVLDQGVRRLDRLIKKRHQLVEALRSALLNAAFSDQL